jgi:hypothetical protein
MHWPQEELTREKLQRMQREAEQASLIHRIRQAEREAKHKGGTSEHSAEASPGARRSGTGWGRLRRSGENA